MLHLTLASIDFTQFFQSFGALFLSTFTGSGVSTSG